MGHSKAHQTILDHNCSSHTSVTTSSTHTLVHHQHPKKAIALSKLLPSTLVPVIFNVLWHKNYTVREIGETSQPTKQNLKQKQIKKQASSLKTRNSFYERSYLLIVLGPFQQKSATDFDRTQKLHNFQVSKQHTFTHARIIKWQRWAGIMKITETVPPLCKTQINVRIYVKLFALRKPK